MLKKHWIYSVFGPGAYCAMDFGARVALTTPRNDVSFKELIKMKFKSNSCMKAKKTCIKTIGPTPTDAKHFKNIMFIGSSANTLKKHWRFSFKTCTKYKKQLSVGKNATKIMKKALCLYCFRPGGLLRHGFWSSRHTHSPQKRYVV